MIDLVKQVFPNITEDTAGYILWNHTGFPGFWDPDDGATTEECCLTQLQRYKKELEEAGWQNPSPNSYETSASEDFVHAAGETI